MCFAILGFVDKAIGGKLGLEQELDIGLANMGTVSVYIIGINCLAVTLVERNVDTISNFTNIFPIDPSILIGCLLAPDLGAVPIALGITDDKLMGYFSGVIVAGCLGQFTSFQLPVIFNMLDTATKPKMIKGFIYGLTAVPFSLMAGGLVIGIAPLKLIFNISIITIICLILLAGLLKRPAGTEKILLVFSNIIKSACQILFIVVFVGIFIPAVSIAPMDIILDALLLILRMIIIICGGLVLVKIITGFFGKELEKVALLLGIDKLSVVGILLNIINTLTVVSKFKDMDDKGVIINGAISVGTSYLLGGQMAFVLFLAPSKVFYGYIVSKLTAGFVGVLIALFFSREKNMNVVNKNERSC